MVSSWPRSSTTSIDAPYTALRSSWITARLRCGGAPFVEPGEQLGLVARVTLPQRGRDGGAEGDFQELTVHAREAATGRRVERGRDELRRGGREPILGVQRVVGQEQVELREQRRGQVGGDGDRRLGSLPLVEQRPIGVGPTRDEVLLERSPAVASRVRMAGASTMSAGANSESARSERVGIGRSYSPPPRSALKP